MQFETGKYYHLYNRSNNEELIFRTDENYLYFLQRYREYFENDFSTVAYCLMPTHFHLLLRERREGGISKFMSKLSTAYSASSRNNCNCQLYNLDLLNIWLIIKSKRKTEVLSV